MKPAKIANVKKGRSTIKNAYYFPFFTERMKKWVFLNRKNLTIHDTLSVMGSLHSICHNSKLCCWLVW